MAKNINSHYKSSLRLHWQNCSANYFTWVSWKKKKRRRRQICRI